MLAHFIHHKGLGKWVILLPLMLAVVLFVIADAFSLTDTRIGAITLILSGIILFLIDDKREKIEEGIIVQRIIKMPRTTGKNTLMWIEVRYWSIAFVLVGLGWLLNPSTVL